MGRKLRNGYVSLPSIRPGPNFSMEVGEEPRGSPAEGHGLAVEEGRGGAPRLLAHPAAFFSSRSGTSAEGAAGRKMEEGAPAAMAELAIFLRTSLHPCSPAARAARSARAAPDGAPWRGADGAGGRCAMERGADGAAAPSSPARFGRGKVSSTLPGGGSGPSGDGSGPAWSRARGGGRVAAVAAAAVSLGVGL